MHCTRLRPLRSVQTPGHKQMNSLATHDAIQRLSRNWPDAVTSDLLDILTLLNDRLGELERQQASIRATANHADHVAGALAHGIHHA